MLPGGQKDSSPFSMPTVRTFRGPDVHVLEELAMDRLEVREIVGAGISVSGN
jgi:hypothetical protein